MVALSSDDGRVTAATICFTFAAAGDYLDGMLARVTGQYSRLGTLMDPFVDRAVILAGGARGLEVRAAAALGACRPRRCASS